MSSTVSLVLITKWLLHFTALWVAPVYRKFTVFFVPCLCCTSLLNWIDSFKLQSNSEMSSYVLKKHSQKWAQPHPGCAQGQGRGQRSRETGTSVMSRNVCYTVPSDVLSLHALTLRSTITPSFQYMCQAARRNVYIMEWATPSLTVWLHFLTCQITVNMVYKL